MKISTRGRYGLRMMIELALSPGQKTVLAEGIAQRQGISENYIHLLAKALKTAGLIQSTRGSKGGYSLCIAPDKITALDVITAMEGKIAVVECTNNRTKCDRDSICVTRDLWQQINQAVETILSGITIEQLSVDQESRKLAQIDFQI